MCDKFQKHIRWLKYWLEVRKRPIIGETETSNPIVLAVLNKNIYDTCYISLQFDHNSFVEQGHVAAIFYVHLMQNYEDLNGVNLKSVISKI